jgi:hypothetical protein
MRKKISKIKYLDENSAACVLDFGDEETNFYDEEEENEE